MADLIDAIRDDHEEIKALLSQVDAGADSDTFALLARKITVHEKTEQAIVHPLTVESGAAAIAQARLDEEAAGTRALEQLKQLGVDAPAFAEAFSSFRMDVLHHAEHEEHEEHPKIRESMNERQLEELGERFRAEERSRLVST